jgi:hypothetical protein
MDINLLFTRHVDTMFPHRASFLNGTFPLIDVMSLQNCTMESTVHLCIKDGFCYDRLSNELFSLSLDGDTTLFWLGNAGGEDDGIDAIAQAENYKDGYAIDVIGKTRHPKFPNREEKDLIIALSKLFPIYSGEIISFKMFAIWEELSKTGIPILVHDVFDEMADSLITSDELTHYFDPTIDTKRFRFKIAKTVD